MFRLKTDLASYNYDVNDINMKAMMLDSLPDLPEFEQLRAGVKYGGNGLADQIVDGTFAIDPDVESLAIATGASWWCFDTGSNVHLTGDKSLFVQIEDIDRESLDGVGTLHVWHERLAHTNLQYVKLMVDRGLVRGMMLSQRQHKTCDACHIGKQKQKRRQKNMDRQVTAPNQIVYADLMFPAQRNGARYSAVLVIMDGWSRYLTVHLLKDKSSSTVNVLMQQYVVWAERQAGRSIKQIVQREHEPTASVRFPVQRILTDKGGEFVNSEIDAWYTSLGCQVYIPSERTVKFVAEVRVDERETYHQRHKFDKDERASIDWLQFRTDPEDGPKMATADDEDGDDQSDMYMDDNGAECDYDYDGVDQDGVVSSAASEASIRHWTASDRSADGKDDAGDYESDVDDANIAGEDSSDAKSTLASHGSDVDDDPSEDANIRGVSADDTAAGGGDSAQLGLKIFSGDINTAYLNATLTIPEIVLLLVYVDDVVCATDDEEFKSTLFRDLDNAYGLKDQGHLTEYLGVQVVQSDNGVFLHQKKYSMNILSKFGYLDANKCGNPMETTVRLASRTNEDAVDTSFDYRGAIGMLMYLATTTRPDLAYVLGQLSRFVSDPTAKHVGALKRVLRYLVGTINYGIAYTKIQSTAGGVITLNGYCDSDWGNDPETRKSISGFVFTIAGGAVSWMSKRQPVVAQSTAEAEYVAACEASMEAMAMTHIVSEILPSLATKPVVGIDNSAAIVMATNPTYSRRTRHIELRWHYVRDQVQRNLLELVKVRGDVNPADVFTKPLDKAKLMMLCELMGVRGEAL
ncbi:hypothetical protein ATCC90586_009433 [Pythium insidiosum]|nr:hypothetical protein ATCC90586_009433 [Pythium insidiosum]